MTDAPLPGLARRLIAEGLMDENAARVAVQNALLNKLPLITHIVQSKLVSGYDIAKVNSELFGIPLMDISTIEMEHVPHDAISEKLIREHRSFPSIKGATGYLLGSPIPPMKKP